MKESHQNNTLTIETLTKNTSHIMAIFDTTVN